MSNSENISLRLATVEDADFLLRLYTASRVNELRGVGWDDHQIQQFCEMQYRARTWQYEFTFKGAVDQIVEIDGERIGRLQVLESNQAIVLVDIALLPEYQNHGIGTNLLEQLKGRACKTGKPLRLHVLVTSLGIRLYQRLGFKRVADDGSYIEMEFQPQTL